jgi:hypothetical protein
MFKESGIDRFPFFSLFHKNTSNDVEVNKRPIIYHSFYPKFVDIILVYRKNSFGGVTFLCPSASVDPSRPSIAHDNLTFYVGLYLLTP